jgi:signal transduction histidine kinase
MNNGKDADMTRRGGTGILETGAVSDSAVGVDLAALVDHVLSCVSHDLKNALSVVRGNAQLAALLITGNDRASTALERIIAAVDGLADALNEVQCMRTPPLGTAAPFDLYEAATAALEAVGDLAEDRGVRCVGPMPADVAVLGYKEHMQQALVHLMRNAIEAMESDGLLTVQVRKEQDRAVATVSDTGPGISREHQAQVFRRFFSTKTGGHGWGLVIVDRVVRVAHQGDVRFTTGPGGTRFTVSLPLGA